MYQQTTKQEQTWISTFQGLLALWVYDSLDEFLPPKSPGDSGLAYVQAAGNFVDNRPIVSSRRFIQASFFWPEGCHLKRWFYEVIYVYNG